MRTNFQQGYIRTASVPISGQTGPKVPKLIDKVDMTGDAIVVRFKANSKITDFEMQENRFGSDSPNLLKNYILELAEGKAKIILDLSNVSYFDSAGLGFLVALNKKNLVLFGVEKVLSLGEQLEVTRLRSILKICPDEQTALQA